MKMQPFLPKYRGTEMEYGSLCIDKLPELAELLGRMTVHWTGVETQVGLLLGSMLGVENAASIAIFNTIRKHAAHRDTLESAAKVTLDATEIRIFYGLMILFDEHEKYRNRAVHGMWGRGAAIHDGVIWSSQADYALFHIRAYHEDETGDVGDRAEKMTSQCYVVKYEDLERHVEDIRNLSRCIGSFHAYLRYKGKIQGDNAMKTLLESQLLQRGLARYDEKILSEANRKSEQEDP